MKKFPEKWKNQKGGERENLAEYRNNYRKRENYIDKNTRQAGYNKKNYYTQNQYKKSYPINNGRNSRSAYPKQIVENRKNTGTPVFADASKLRRKIMADDAIKYVCGRNEDIIHDKSCILARNIKDYDLKYLVNYPKWMKQCPHCAMEAYVRNGARDYENFPAYVVLFRLMMISEELLRHIYIDCEMQTKVNGETLTVWYKEDTWKIVYLDSPGYVRLLHNNYHVENNQRVFEKSFHIQSDFTSNTKIRFAFENIETYSWSMHRVHAKEAELERKKNEEKKGLFSRIGQAFASLFQRKDEEDQKNAADDDRKEDPAEFQLNFSDFNLVRKYGYPDNGTRCIYIWKTKNGIYQWQIGEYIAKKKQFVIKFSDQTFITDWRKVVAWKYVWKGDLNWSYGGTDEKNADSN